MADPKLSQAAQVAVEKIKAELEAEYNRKKIEVEAAAKRKPWAVVAWSAGAGAALALIIQHWFF